MKFPDSEIADLCERLADLLNLPASKHSTEIQELMDLRAALCG